MEQNFSEKFRRYSYIIIGSLLLFICAILIVSNASALPLSEVVKKNTNTYNNYTLVNETYYNSTGTNVNESYAYLLGRAGGQVLTGGTQANDDLILNGTSSGTKTTSYVILQPDGGNVAIGSANPEYGFDVISPSGIFRLQDSKADSTNKISRIIGSSYLNAEEPVNFINFASVIGDNYLSFGGGNPYNAVTEISFKTSPSVNSINSVSRLVIIRNGFVGLGTITPSSQFHTTGTVRFASLGAGTVTADAGGNLTSVSDEKYKTNIKSISSIGAISKIKSLNPVTFNYKVESGLDSANTYAGLLAGEVKRIIPEAVKTKQDVRYETVKTKSKDGEDIETTIEIPLGTTTDSLDDRAIIDVLILGIQEQQKQIDDLQKQINELKGVRT